MIPLRILAVLVIVVAGWLAGACAANADKTPELSANLGGATTLIDVSQNAFSLPAPGLSNQHRRLFERGDSFFTQNWVTAPASTEARDGLGPTFNAQACSSCHLRDGRGMPLEEISGQLRLGLLIRLSVPGEHPQTGAPQPDPTYGGQLQDKAVLGVAAEGRIALDYESVEGTYGDGTTYELRRPLLEIVDLSFGPLSDDVMMSPRLSPQIIGMGLLEVVPEDAILARADPEDADGDGISGRVNTVWDSRKGQATLGRFGWKANVATVEQQVAGAFHGDIGITSTLHPAENCPLRQDDCAEAPNGGSPELSDSRLEAVTFYSGTLAVPAMRGLDESDVIAGAELFSDIGCSSCHVQSLRTGESDLAVLSDQVIHPFTDMLLHDMGEDLADNRPDFDASGSEWRTAPLWGLGLIDDVNGARFLLHDGRARTIEEAILWHGGEAESSREAFRLLDAHQRQQLVSFLEAL